MYRMNPIQYNLPQSRIPQAWYNILPDLPKPLAPVLHPATLKPIGPDDLAPLFPMSVILQEVSTEARSRSRKRCAKCTRSGGLRRYFERAVWNGLWIRRRGFITSTKGWVRRASISRMVRVSYNQKPYRRALMEVLGASVTASPSNETAVGTFTRTSRRTIPSGAKCRISRWPVF